MTTPAEVVRTDLRSLLARNDGWRTQLIPGSTEPVRLWRLHLDRTTSATVSLVDFPAGWQRPVEGSYSVAEEFVILDGELAMNGRRFAAGDWAFVPAGARRAASAADRGALAVAWFGGVPEWSAGESDAAAQVAVLERGTDPGDRVLLAPSPPHGGSELATGRLEPSARRRDVLDAHRWLWWWLPPQTSWSAPGAHVFVRSW